ncbi:Cytochrome P450 81Q32, partial [Cucurbita argyrosperma subsp. sororia]
MGDFIPLMSWLGLGWAAEKEIMECHQKRDAFMQNLINQHKNRAIETEPDNSFRDGRKKTLIEVLLELQESDPDQYNDETIRALMLVLPMTPSVNSDSVIVVLCTRLQFARQVLSHICGLERFRLSAANLDKPHSFDARMRLHDDLLTNGVFSYCGYWKYRALTVWSEGIIRDVAELSKVS